MCSHPGFRGEDTVRRGRRFEDAAARHLADHGLTILARNVRFRRGEIDLVAQDGEVVVFVEVKGRTGHEYGHPLEALTARKRREVEAVARAWIRGHPRAAGYRFDAVSVLARGQDEGQWCITHVRDAWRPGAVR